MVLWTAAYERAHGDVTMTTAGTGSGAGIAQALAGSVELGMSDAYLSDAQSVSAFDVPLAVSAQVVAYNVQEIGDRHINLSGPLLAAIYSGAIAYWDDARIAQINPQLREDLPHARIGVIRRSDSSGDTFMFTQYLARTATAWKSGFGTQVAWPKLPDVIVAKGNAGVVDSCLKHEYSIAYVAVSYVAQIGFSGLGYAALQSRDGAFLLPQPDTMEAAVAGSAIPADGRVSLVDRPGPNAYPIVNYEYAVVRRHQAGAEQADALRSFLSWAIDPAGGNDQARFLSALNFVALPPAAREVSRRLIAQIK